MGKVEQKASQIENHPVAAGFASVGHVVNGLVHILIGALAVGVATGLGGESADKPGAMRAIRSTPVGGIVLWVAAIALFALAVYSVISAIGLAREDAKDAVKAAGQGIGFGAVGSVALTYALGGSSDGEQTNESISAQLMATTWGAVLLFIIGAVVLAIGIGMIVSGVKKKFLKDVDISGRFRTTFSRLGTVGYIAKGVAIGIMGVLFIVAVLTRNPDEAAGLDGALKTLIGLPFGVFLLVLVGVGLILYGIFCFAKARTVVRRAD